MKELFPCEEQARRVKILVVSTDYPPMKGGIAVLSHATALEFQRAGHEVCVVASCLDDGAAEVFDKEQPFRTIRFSGRLLWRELQIGPVLWRAIRGFQPDVVWSALWFPAGVAVTYCAPRQVVQAVSTYGSEIFISRFNWKLRLKAAMAPWRHRVFRKCRNIFALSHFTRKKILELGAPPEKIEIVMGGVGNHWFDLEKLPVDPERPILLTVARLDQHKGHDGVIEALPKVLKSHPGLRYVLVGTGHEGWPRLRDLAASLGVERNVEYRGALPVEELFRAYREATLFTMMSRELPGRLDLVEGFGLTFLEAAALGLPSVAGDSGGVPDAVEHEVSGLLVDPTSPAEIAEGILRFLDDPAYLTRLGQQARERALREFTWPYLAGKMLTSFERSLKERQTR